MEGLEKSARQWAGDILRKERQQQAQAQAQVQAMQQHPPYRNITADRIQALK